MAQARHKTGKERGAADSVARAERLRGIISALGLAATDFLSKPKVEAMAAQWLSGVRQPQDENEAFLLFANASLLAMSLAVFTPSMTGQTAIDRLARRHQAADADELAALQALRGSRFRLLAVDVALPPLGFRVRDLASGEVLHLIDGEMPAACVGLSIACRICPVEDGLVVPVGPMTPLDEAMLDLARQYIRPNGRGLAAQKCAEALYRHAVRHGGPRVPGLNASAKTGGTFPYSPEDGPAHALAFALADRGAAPTERQLQAARELTSIDNIIDAMSGISLGRAYGPETLASAYETLALIQMETIERRAASGIAGSLDRVAAAIEREIADGELPTEARDMFRELRRRVRVTPPKQTAGNVDLDKVLGRIQALREKTVEKGCTEQEALAAAEKVAELLDRYGLSLSEVELKNQTCEGFGVETGRKRLGPIDACIPAVASFCDCRVWREKTATDEIRYVFFGLPADVAGARYLYDLIERAFETETEAFKAGPLYFQHPTSQRRTATTSFQTGLSDGIARKLHALHAEREAAMRTSTGRDLVPIKESVLEDELARLGMTFTSRSAPKGKRVLSDAYEAGREAGEMFEYRPGIERSA
ncbi:MAG: DUF2786 domain-containing protein [Alphaproteobacteria bacterium]